MLIVSMQSYLEGRLQQYHGTGLKLVSPALHYQHPFCYLLAHTIHGIPISHGFSNPLPSSLSKQSILAQNFVFESRWFNFWRGSQKRLIASFDMNKRFDIAFARRQTLNPGLALSEDKLHNIKKLEVCWSDSQILLAKTAQIQIFHACLKILSS